MNLKLDKIMNENKGCYGDFIPIDPDEADFQDEYPPVTLIA